MDLAGARRPHPPRLFPADTLQVMREKPAFPGLSLVSPGMGYVVWFSLGNLRIVAFRKAAALRLNVGSLGQISESFVEVHKSVCCAQMSDSFVLSKGTGLIHSFLIPAVHLTPLNAGHI